jgi:hypothetical protein
MSKVVWCGDIGALCVCVGIESRHLFEEEELDPRPPPLVVVVAKGKEGGIGCLVKTTMTHVQSTLYKC